MLAWTCRSDRVVPARPRRAPLLVERRVDLHRGRKLSTRGEPCGLVRVPARTGGPGAVDPPSDRRDPRASACPHLLELAQVPDALVRTHLVPRWLRNNSKTRATRSVSAGS